MAVYVGDGVGGVASNPRPKSPYEESIQNSYQEQLNEQHRQKRAEELRLKAQANHQISQYEAQKPALKQQFTDNAQDAYIRKMQSLKEMPQVLAAQGYNGGLSESSNIKVDNTYGNAYNGHQRDYNTGLREVDGQINNARASLSDSLSQNSTRYGAMMSDASAAYQQLLAQAAREKQAQDLQEQVRQQVQKSGTPQADENIDFGDVSPSAPVASNAYSSGAYDMLRKQLMYMPNASEAQRQNFVDETINNLVRSGKISQAGALALLKMF